MASVVVYGRPVAEEAWTILNVLDWTTGRFQQAGLPSPRLEAQVLLAHALGTDRVSLYTQFDKPLGDDELGRFRELIRRRLAGEPTAYLTGEQEFWSLPLAIEPVVLIPRHDTETLVEVVLDHLGDKQRAVRIADLGTGSGAVAVALAHELRNARVIASDTSPDAVRIATANAERNRVADRLEVRAGDLLAALAGEPPFDVLAANLPYVPSATIDGLQPEVRHEPRAALDGGPDGLDLIRRLIAGARPHLLPGGLLALEHGFDQGPAVRALIDATGGFEPAVTRNDLAGNPRITSAIAR